MIPGVDVAKKQQRAAKLQVRREVHELPQLSLRAAVVPDSLDEEKRTVEVVWTTGARVYRPGWFSDFYEELSLDPAHVRMGRLQSGAPLLNAHSGYDANSVIGVVESARLEKGQGVAVVRFAKPEDDPAADSVFRKVKDKILRDVSVGYRVHKMEKVEEEEGSAPVYRAVDWEPYEISVVPMGADPGSKIRGSGGADGAPAATYPCSFEERETTMSVKRKKKISARAEETAAEETQAEAVEEVAAEETVAAEDAAEDEAVAAEPAERAISLAEKRGAELERKRAAGINRTAMALGLPAEFAQRHVAAGTSLQRFNTLAIDERAEVATLPTRVQAVSGGDARDKLRAGMSDWLIERAGLATLVKRAAEKRGETVVVDPGEFRGLGFLDLARRCLEAQGIRTAGMDKVKLIGRALTERIGGLHGAGDFPILLENTMHKVLLASYEITDDTWSQFCATGSVSDFRPHNRYRLGTFGRLERVNEHGEFRNQQIPDAEKESISADTFGNIIGLTRQALINDDMSAFSRLAVMLGRAARLSIEADVYDLLAENAGLGPDMADGQPLFDASHNNIGEGSALSVAGIYDDRVLMGRQMDPTGNEFLSLRPAILLLADALGGEARVINEAEFDVDQIAPDLGNFSRKPNRARGVVTTIIDTPRIEGTRRYMFADPSVAPTIEVAFLEGQQTPYLEVKDGWRTDGVEWKIRLDYGMAAVDFRGAVTNAGEVES